MQFTQLPANDVAGRGHFVAGHTQTRISHCVNLLPLHLCVSFLGLFHVSCPSIEPSRRECHPKLLVVSSTDSPRRAKLLQAADIDHIELTIHDQWKDDNKDVEGTQYPGEGLNLVPASIAHVQVLTR
jgi:hypothetical protein